MKTFKRGEPVTIRRRLSKEWVTAKYIKATEDYGVSGWHYVRNTDGAPEKVPDTRIRRAVAIDVESTERQS